ncbi:MAG TPA: kelch repeat-containing protein [Nocardioidaceae bacterium]
MTRWTTQALAGTGAVLAALLAGACSVPVDESPEMSPRVAPAPEAESDLPRWERLDGLDVPRDDFGTAVVGDEIWVLGGMTGDRGTRLDSVEVLDTTTGRWRTSPVTVPEGLASFESAAVGRRIYLFGGLDVRSRASDFAAVLDTRTGSWRRLPELPTARYAHTVTLHEGLIHVIGGEGPDGAVEQVDVFNPATESWTTGTPMPLVRNSHDAVSTDEGIHVLGGWRDGAPSDVVQTYDPTAGSWTRQEPLPEPMSRAGAAALDGRLWVSLHAASYVLDLRTGDWSTANPLTVSRHGLGYVAHEGRIYGIGGCTPSPLRDVRTVDVLEVL